MKCRGQYLTIDSQRKEFQTLACKRYARRRNRRLSVLPNLDSYKKQTNYDADCRETVDPLT
jgi:hypothetical protein